MNNPFPSTQDIQGKKYPGFGRCIYCGSDGGADGLRDEHIIPFSLHGNTEIRDASCTSCEKKINPVDLHLARSVYGNFRIHAGVQTRNPKDRPSELPAQIRIGDNEFTRNFPIKDHPYSLALPVWGPAGFLRSNPIDAPFPEACFHIYHFTPHNFHQTLGLPPGDNEVKIWARGKIDVTLFARGIAKIAYCHAILRFGLNGFRSLVLPKIILGECPAVGYFVGGPLDIPPPKYDNNVLHAIHHADLTAPTGRMKLHAVHVRLFANSAHDNHGMPIYHVIVGAPKHARSNE